jgi:hypothetical protein
MAESHVVSGLKAKRDEIKRAIRDQEQKLKSTRADLATINEALAIFGETSKEPRTYYHRDQIFDRGDLPRIIFDALRAATRPLSTTELAAIVMQAKGFDTENRELATRVSHGVGMALNRYRKYGQVVADSFAGKVRRWRTSILTGCPFAPFCLRVFANHTFSERALASHKTIEKRNGKID